jgi:hypothetical protein
MIKDENKPDRFAAGTGSTNAEMSDDPVMPGVKGGGKIYLPQSGGAEGEGSGASSAEGTIGAVGEMDLTGAPAEAGGGGSNSGKSEGGGPGGGAV